MKNLISITLLCCGILASCYRDKGNYDYITLPEVTIKNLEDNYTIAQLDNLVLEPEVVTVNDEYGAEDWEYLWRMYPGKNTIDTIGNERILDYQFTEEPGTYNLLFTAINKQTDLKFTKDIVINLSGVYMDGMMVLYEVEGGCDFDLINDRFFSKYDQDEDIYFRHLYETLHGSVFPGNPMKIAAYYYPLLQYDYIFTDEKAVRLSVNSMEELQDINNFMLGVSDLKYENYYHTSYDSYLKGAEIILGEGKILIYGRGGSNGFSEPIAMNGITYYAAPFASIRHDWPIVATFYDQEHCCFLQVLYQVYEVHEMTDYAGAPFSVNNMNAELIYMGEGFNRYNYAVMRDLTSGAYSLYVFDFYNAATFAVAKYSMDQCPELSNAISFALGSRGEVFYYATKDKVYRYDYNTNNKASDCIQSLNLAAGEEITCMRLFRPVEYNYFPEHPYDNKVLFVATYNSTNNAGKIYMYYINEANGIVDESSVKTIDIDGRIKDMSYHYSTYGAF